MITRFRRHHAIFAAVAVAVLAAVLAAGFVLVAGLAGLPASQQQTETGEDHRLLVAACIGLAAVCAITLALLKRQADALALIRIDVEVAQSCLRGVSAALHVTERIARIGHWSYRFGALEMRWSDEVHELLMLQRSDEPPTRADILSLMTPESRKRLSEAEAGLMRGRKSMSVDVEMQRGDGSFCDFVISARAERDADGAVRGFVGTIQDISERKAAERNLERLAYRDPLSGLGNRALFQKELSSFVAHGRESGRKGFTLMLIDLDRFKEVNDTMGHPAGDELLFLVSDRLRQIVPAEARVARIGGDEFAVIVPHVDARRMQELGDAIITDLSKPVELSEGAASISASIGIALWPAHGKTEKAIVSSADTALYQAKGRGRGVAVLSGEDEGLALSPGEPRAA